jgi:hypothetical protein
MVRVQNDHPIWMIVSAGKPASCVTYLGFMLSLGRPDPILIWHAVLNEALQNERRDSSNKSRECGEQQR